MLAAALRLVLPALLLLAPQARGEEPSPEQRQQVERLIHDYLMREPEVVYDALKEWQHRQEAADADKRRAAIASHHEAIFAVAGDPVVGSPTGKVTLVEFFDYHCGYCRKMMPDLRSLVEHAGDIRLVLKDIPILGAESVIAAKAALAAQSQGRYADMHWALMSSADLSEAGVLATAKQLGLDTAKLAADMNSAAVKARIDANLQLAGDLDIGGTPTFIIGEHFIPGAIPIGDLAELVQQGRTAQ